MNILPKPIVVDGEFCYRISLNRGKSTIVDAVDLSKLVGYRWLARKDRNTWYAYRNVDGRTIHVHQVVCRTRIGRITDHRNGNGLDNRRKNLRKATFSQNQQNRIHLNPHKTSQYRGVCWDKGCKRWRADLMFNQRNRYLGLHPDEKSAALAYDEAARKHFGEFARLNFPDENSYRQGARR